MNINTAQSTKKIFGGRKINRSNKISSKDKSLIEQFEKDLKNNGDKLLRKFELHMDSINNGINALVKLRTGSFMFSNNLIKRYNFEQTHIVTFLFGK